MIPEHVLRIWREEYGFSEEEVREKVKLWLRDQPDCPKITVSRGVRLPRDLLDRIETLAIKKQISLNAALVRLIQAGYKMEAGQDESWW